MSRAFSDLFEETRWYEENKKPQNDSYRMKYHLMPPTGWMNDPNGLCVFHGVYHVFFQYTPAEATGAGYRGWGHYTSENLTDWHYEGFCLAPDTEYDRDGAYSGSALIDGEKMYLYYTGNVKEQGEYDYILSGRGANVILVTVQDGFPTGKEVKEILLTNADYPEDYSCHVRDPKVWKEENSYYMILGGRTKQDKGKAIIYRSEDKRSWEPVNQITVPYDFGYMWECPDLFELGGTMWLSLSPQGLESEEYRYQNIYQSGYFEMSGDFRGEYALSRFTEWDMGFDFYAPQTFEDEGGRRILFGWVGMPDAEYTNPTVRSGWQHCLTLPREIIRKGGKLCQKPVEELKALRGEERQIPAGEELTVSGAYELWMEVQNPGKKIEMLEIAVSEGVFLRYDGHQKIELMLTDAVGAGRRVRKALISELKDVRMYVDFSVIEIFINGGELTLTTRFYPMKHSLKIEAENTVNRLWEINRI